MNVINETERRKEAKAFKIQVQGKKVNYEARMP